MELSKLSLAKGENDASNKYASWLVKHPCALDTFEEMMKAAKGKKIVLFFDYDGTLSDFVPNPEEAFMTDRMRMVLYEVANRFPTAIISGRRLEKLQEFVKLKNLYYAGSQGLDIEAPLPLDSTNSKEMDNKVVLHQPPIEALIEKEKILHFLNENTRAINGVNIEDNKFCISVHYRSIHPEDVDMVEILLYEAVYEEEQNFRLITTGKQVYEIVPDIVWNKGCALEYFLDNLGFVNSNDVLPIYIGDDQTDEDAFEVLRKRGQGFPIIVTTTPENTKALYSLREPKDVMEFLLRLLAA